MTALAARSISVAYGREDVVHGATLELVAGQVTALVGPNGSGKSTLLRAVARLQTPRTGALALRAPVRDTPDPDVSLTDGLALSPKAFARQVALLTQGRPVPGGLRVREVVAFGRYPYRRRLGGTDVEGESAIAHALTATGLQTLSDRAVDQLSGGQLQRVWLASCLAQQTGVMLLDEPTTYLDLRYQVELLDLVRDLADQRAIAVGLVLHDLDQAAAVADRVVLLNDGRVLADGAPEEVLTSEQLTAVYGIRVNVDTDPSTGLLRTRAVGRHHIRTERLSKTP